jgi:hypothetical protein
MRCEEVRPVIPEIAEGALRVAGPTEEHLASCPGCGSDLARYQRILLELSLLRDEVIEPPKGLLGALLAELPEYQRRRLIHRMVADERMQHAAFSLGGAVLGATAIALLWWRAVRRNWQPAGGSSE